VILTDDLIKLVNDDEVVLGVLGHEAGHVIARHGMQQLVRITLMQTALSVAFGDYGNLITIAPLALGSMGYSREAEREADAASMQFMQANNISPLVMVKFFTAVRAEQAKKEKDSPLNISIISSHPADAERMEAFRKASK
jgi:Zn-dependent protease with chaperone function